MELPLPSLVGPYQLQHLLGSGGMGQVFAAVHERMGQPVALKLLFPAAARDPQLVARFLQEARALAQLEHPGVVRVLHCDRLGDMVFLAMERLEGLSLREWMRRQSGPVSFQPTLMLCGQIADIMVDVHARGIVHRDLKPENVFLCPEDADATGYRVKLLDFGIAKLPPAPDGTVATTQIHTHESTFIGTYAYMAPEQLRSAATVDGRADVYALGVLLFEMLAGRTPFVSDDPVDVISAHIREEPPPLKQFVPAIPGALSAFIASMLAKDPAERPTMSRCRDMLGRPWEREQDVCPVPGLAAFTESQAELFFGRTAETQALLTLLEESRAGRRRWVQIEGSSGVGKSSLIQAGLLPRLKESSDQGAPQWLIATMRPSDEPLRSLAQALAAVYVRTGPDGTPEALLRMLREGPDALQTFVTAHTPEGCCLLLVLEPMEELFTLGAGECLHVDALLSTALAAPDSPLRLLTSMRSDFLHKMEQVPSLARRLHEAARYALLPMEEAALAQVIQGMAWHSGLRLSSGLAERMVNDTRSEGSRLPLLGHALRGLWALSEGGQLTLEHYERLGGVGGALARQAEALLDSLGTEGRERAKWLLLELVQVGRGVPDTRRPRMRQEVLAAAGGDRLAEEVLLRLTGMRTGDGPEVEQSPRLVMLSGGGEPSEQRVDLTHETLLHKVPSIAAWLEQERALLERHADLEVAAYAWEQARCPAEGLPTGTLLAHYRGGTEALSRDRALVRRVSPRAARFLDVAARLERRRAWGRRGLLAAALVAVVVIAFYAVSADRERNRAEENLRQLIAITDNFVSESDWQLSWTPHTLDTRQKLLQGFRKVLTSLPEEERWRPDVRLVSIKVHHRQGDLALYDERLADAERHLLDALEELRAGLALQPADGDLRKLLGLNHSKLGKVALARGRWEEARAHFNEAMVLLENKDTNLEDEDSRRSLAVSLSELADLELASNNLKAAAGLYDQAISLHEENSGTYNEALLALTLASRGEVARRADEVGVAQDLLERALRLGRRCVLSQTHTQFSRWVLARALVELAALRVMQDEPEAAELLYQEAEDLGRVLMQGEAPNKRFALVLDQALLGHEELARAQGLHDQTHTLRDERCMLVRKFLNGDSEDVRFQLLGCVNLQGGKN